MKRKLFQNKIFIQKSKMHGYGVFAGKSFKKGELIEECYILLASGKDLKLENFYFDAGRGQYAMFSGFGCIYNHSDEPNVDYVLDVKNKVATFKTERAVKKGEELLISYGEDWFKERGIKPKK